MASRRNAADGDAVGYDARARARANDVYERLLAERIVFLGTQLDDALSDLIVSQILLLSSTDLSRDIYLYINCPGGWAKAAMAIYDAMHYVDCDVGTICHGLAAGAGHLLLCAGAPGKRYALPHSRICMRAPSFPPGSNDVDAVPQRRHTEQLVYIKRIWADLIAQHTGHKVEQIEADFDRDRWFTPDEARAYGIIDHVIERSRQVPC